jgi:ABC-type branched-subunit amino acid transport system substrate-binding protein
MILQQMQELGMKQRVFGSHRTIGDELLQKAGPLAEGFEAVFPYDPTREDRAGSTSTRFRSEVHEKPDHFAALAYDAMQVLLNAPSARPD